MALSTSITNTSPDGLAHAIEAGKVVLEGRGDGTYSEAETAIELLLSNLTALSPSPSGDVGDQLCELTDQAFGIGFLAGATTPQHTSDALLRAFEDMRYCADQAITGGEREVLRRLYSEAYLKFVQYLDAHGLTPDEEQKTRIDQHLQPPEQGEN